MYTDRLSPFQHRILTLLAPVEPRWTFTRGAALAGCYIGHRTTRDLDLFFRDLNILGDVTRLVTAQLCEAGFEVSSIQHAPPAFMK